MEIENFAHATGTGKSLVGIGTEVNPNASIDEWRDAAGWNWTVDESPVYYRAGDQALVAEDRRIFYRSDRPEIVLGNTSDKFNPVQPSEVLEFFDQLRNETGIQIDSLGTFKNGKKFWGLATTDGEIEIGGEKMYNKIMGATANDGSMSTRFGGTPIRPICQNTFTMALGRGSFLSVNHRGKVNWDSIRKWILGENETFYLFGDIMQELYKIPVDNMMAAEFSASVIAPDWDRKSKAPRTLTKFAETLNHGKGQREAGKTAFGLFNGVTRYVDHEKQSRGQESRMDSAWFGAGNTLKQQAFDKLIADCVNKWGYESQLAPVLRETKYKSLVS